MYHKLNTPPVVVYNLNDVNPEKDTVALVEEITETDREKQIQKHTPEPTHRRYIERIERILDVAQTECQSEAQILYELVSEMFRNGFEKEFQKGE